MKQVLHIDGKAVTLDDIARKGGELSFTLGKKTYRFRATATGIEQEIAPGVWQRFSAFAATTKNGKRVQVAGLEASIAEQAKESGGGSALGALSPTAPMPGVVRQILVKKGERVSAGQPVAVMEAMKLQMTLNAGGDAIVESVLVKEGDMIAEGAELVKLKAKAA